MTHNMTVGSIPRNIISFAVPMIFGNMFQLTYNAVDSIIVGQKLGTDALAAVGAASPIMNIIIFLIVGICMGASVLMSEFFGAGEYENLKKEVSTTVITGFIFTAVMSVVFTLLAKPVLMLVRTPQEILEQSAGYLRIIFAGLLFTFVYNVYAAALRSVGDAVSPIIFLIFSSVLNVILDLVFVLYLQMGVNGTAWATVVSQAASSVLCVIYVWWKSPLLRTPRGGWKIESSLLLKTVNYSWVTALQQTCLYIGKVLIQGAVNPLGVSSVATFNAVTRIDDFAFVPQQSIAQSMTVFIAQNWGAGETRRIRKGFRVGMYSEIVYWFFLSVTVFLGAKFVMRLFVKDAAADVITLGVAYLQAMAVFYIMPGLTNGLQGYFRGMGDLKVTLLSTAVQMAGRVSLSYLLAPMFGIAGIAYSCFGGWVVMMAVEVPIYIYSVRSVRVE